MYGGQIKFLFLLPYVSLFIVGMCFAIGSADIVAEIKINWTDMGKNIFPEKKDMSLTGSSAGESLCLQNFVEVSAARQNPAEPESKVDSLTGLLNKKGFEEKLKTNFNLSHFSAGTGEALIFIELDNYWTICENYGCETARRAIRLLARCLQDHICAPDILARYESEVFAIFLGNENRDEAVRRAQLMSWQLNRLSIAYESEEIDINTSLCMKAYDEKSLLEEVN
jgi:diguanylate cyclase (GGDEF)-like protein